MTYPNLICLLKLAYLWLVSLPSLLAGELSSHGEERLDEILDSDEEAEDGEAEEWM